MGPGGLAGGQSLPHTLASALASRAGLQVFWGESVTQSGAVPQAKPVPTQAGADRPSLPVKLAYGFGAAASGVKSNGFSYFLLLYYTQVIGLDARLVGLALTIALVLDAISDPIVGYWSDNFRSRLGRRHLFMYLSAIPVAATYYLMWDPPTGWSQEALFWYLLALAVLIRTFITFYETPSTALAAELTGDYDQRSSILSYRYFFAWFVGNAMSVMMFLVIFPMFVTATISNGQFNRASYELYGYIAAGVIFVAIMVSSLGTHSRIPFLKPPPAARRMTLWTIFGEIFETLGNRSFIALFVASIFAAIAGGMTAALAFYFFSFFWGFTPAQVGLITIGVFASALIGPVMATIVTRTIGKKLGAMIIGVIAFGGAPLPIVLRLFDLLPPNDDPFVFWFVFATTTIDTGLIICFQVLSASMLADLAEQAELRTGRRSEAIFFAAQTFIGKITTGFGIMGATFLLTAIGFPSGAKPGEVPADVLWTFGAYYVPITLGLWMTMLAVMSAYTISRETHAENLRALAKQSGAE